MTDQYKIFEQIKCSTISFKQTVANSLIFISHTYFLSLSTLTFLYFFRLLYFLSFIFQLSVPHSFMFQFHLFLSKFHLCTAELKVIIAIKIPVGQDLSLIIYRPHIPCRREWSVRVFKQNAALIVIFIQYIISNISIFKVECRNGQWF